MNAETGMFGSLPWFSWGHVVAAQTNGFPPTHTSHLSASAGAAPIVIPLGHAAAWGPLHGSSGFSHTGVGALHTAPVLHIPGHMAHLRDTVLGAVAVAFRHVFVAHGFTHDCGVFIVVDSMVHTPVLVVPPHLHGLSGHLASAAQEALHVAALDPVLVRHGLTPAHPRHNGVPHAGTGHNGAVYPSSATSQQSVRHEAKTHNIVSHDRIVLGYVLTPVFASTTQEAQLSDGHGEPPHRHAHDSEHIHHNESELEGFGGRFGHMARGSAATGDHAADAAHAGVAGSGVGEDPPAAGLGKAGRGDPSQGVRGAGHNPEGDATGSNVAHGLGRNGSRPGGVNGRAKKS